MLQMTTRIHTAAPGSRKNSVDAVDDATGSRDAGACWPGVFDAMPLNGR